MSAEKTNKNDYESSNRCLGKSCRKGEIFFFGIYQVTQTVPRLRRYWEPHILLFKMAIATSSMVWFGRVVNAFTLHKWHFCWPLAMSQCRKNSLSCFGALNNHLTRQHPEMMEIWFSFKRLIAVSENWFLQIFLSVSFFSFFKGRVDWSTKVTCSKYVELVMFHFGNDKTLTDPLTIIDPH